MSRGALDVVGTGFLAGAHGTEETLAALRRADQVFYLVSEPVTAEWLEDRCPAAESLSGAYAEGKPRAETYREIRERILSAVRHGRRVCAAFYGHPGVFVQPSHAAIEQARQEGFPARMLPGISAEDCLFADLEVDPLERGCQSFEATHFLWGLRFDPQVPLVLWQAGIVGVTTTLAAGQGSPEGLRRLAAVLLRHYPPSHRVIAYEAPSFGVFTARAEAVPLAGLPALAASVTTTLYVPPLGAADGAPASRPEGPLRLVVVGTGHGDGRMTTEARTCLERAGQVLAVVDDPRAAEGLLRLCPRARVLADEADAAGEAVAALRRGTTVCVVFPGHPCVGQPAAGAVLRAARAQGFAAQALPGISWEDCLFADLGIDPGEAGRVLFSTESFCAASRIVDPKAPLLLLRAHGGAALYLPPP